MPAGKGGLRYKRELRGPECLIPRQQRKRADPRLSLRGPWKGLLLLMNPDCKKPTFSASSADVICRKSRVATGVGFTPNKGGRLRLWCITMKQEIDHEVIDREAETAP